jgi:glycosyltransferase involved in cell wall biosynthesis
MKIFFVAPRFHTNQVEWVRGLRCAGHEVIYHVLLRGGTENYSEIEPIVLTQCRFSIWLVALFGPGGENLYRGFPAPVSYFRHMLRLRPDIIIVRDIGRWSSFLAATCGRILGVKIVIYSQTALYKHYSVLRRSVTWVILKVFRACWMTPIIGDRSIGVKPPSNMFYVPFSVPIGNVCPKEIQPPFRIISIGKFEPRKNHRLLLRALDQLEIEGRDFRLIIIGEVSKPRHFQEHALVLDEIANLALSGRVTVAINIEHQEMPTYYANADLFVLPATAEPASISVLEALGYGLPVICSDTCGTRWYVENKKTGYFFKDCSVDDLVAVLRRALDRDELHHMKKACAETAYKEISSTAFITDFHQMLRCRFGV